MERYFAIVDQVPAANERRALRVGYKLNATGLWWRAHGGAGWKEIGPANWARHSCGAMVFERGGDGAWSTVTKWDGPFGCDRP